MGLFGGGGSKTKIVSLLSSAARGVNVDIGDLLQEFLQTGESPYSGGLTAPIPGLFTEAYERLAGTMGQYTDVITGALERGVEGVPAYEFDEGVTAQRWKEGFAIPAMETWRQTIQPLVEEQFASIPGGFYSRDRARGVTDEASRYFERAIQPQLYGAYQADIERGFVSGEAAAARVPGAVSQLAAYPGAEFSTYAGAANIYQQLQQQPLTANYQEYMNLLNASLGFATTPTKTAVQAGGGGGSGLGSLIGGATLGGLGGLSGLGIAGGPWGVVAGAGLGMLMSN